MKDQLQKRLTQLKTEFANGQNALSELQAKQNELQTTLLRISGAIQVLEEILGKEDNTKKEMVKTK